MLAKAQEAQVLVEGTERNRVVTFQAEPSMRFLELLEAKKWLDARKPMLRKNVLASGG